MMKVKVCCISSIEEANLAIKFGASAIGLVGPMPSGPGIIEDELIKEIAKSVDRTIDTFLLTSETKADKIIEHHQRVNTNTIQLVDSIENDQYSIIRKALPNVQLIQVIHVHNEDSISEAQLKSTFVDALLLDSGNPSLEIRELGGTGRVHNWAWSKSIVQSVAVPVYLAGGLKAENIKQAVSTVQPHGVDLCSGVRTNNKLDEQKLKAFFNNLKSL